LFVNEETLNLDFSSATFPNCIILRQSYEFEFDAAKGFSENVCRLGCSIDVVEAYFPF
jgi:hypothetical protein